MPIVSRWGGTFELWVSPVPGLVVARQQNRGLCPCLYYAALLGLVILQTCRGIQRCAINLVIRHI